MEFQPRLRIIRNLLSKSNKELKMANRFDRDRVIGAFGECFGNYSDDVDDCRNCMFAIECHQYCVERGIENGIDFNAAFKDAVSESQKFE